MASQTEYLKLQLLGTSSEDKQTYFEQWRQTINGEIDNSNMKIIDAAIKAISEDISDLKYVPIAISSFVASPATAEKGNVIRTVDFTFGLNKVPTTLKFDSETLDPVQNGTKKLQSLQLTGDTTWTLEATDSGSATESPRTVTKTVKLAFMNKVYWGVGAVPASLDSAFIRNLANSTLSTSKARTFTVNAGSGEYVWYAVPASLGAVAFKVGGFDGGFEAAQRLSFTNQYEYTEDYLVYRSTNASLGQTTVTAS